MDLIWQKQKQKKNTRKHQYHNQEDRITTALEPEVWNRAHTPNSVTISGSMPGKWERKGENEKGKHNHLSKAPPQPQGRTAADGRTAGRPARGSSRPVAGGEAGLCAMGGA
jgi:hypothetical protein